MQWPGDGTGTRTLCLCIPCAPWFALEHGFAKRLFAALVDFELQAEPAVQDTAVELADQIWTLVHDQSSSDSGATQVDENGSASPHLEELEDSQVVNAEPHGCSDS